jgi:hypothetical protein
LRALNEIRRERDLPPLAEPFMPRPWRDLYQAVTITILLAKRNKPATAQIHASMLKALAMCAPGSDPSELSGEQTQMAYNALLRVEQGTAVRKLAVTVRHMDTMHLLARMNLAAHCKPYPDVRSLKCQSAVDRTMRQPAITTAGGNSWTRRKRLLGELHERKDVLKLPETAAFWELCRIVFMEEPGSVYDLQLFAAARIHIITGLRSGEVSLLPLDWERWQEWTDLEGTPAGRRGGISRSLSIRHFAEKQRDDEGPTGLVLVPRRQHVPDMFEDVVLETLHEVEKVTHPMRETLKRQAEVGRFFPDCKPDQLLPAWEVYLRLTGDVRVSSAPVSDSLVRRYLCESAEADGSRSRFDAAVSEEMLAEQLAWLASPALATNPSRMRRSHETNTRQDLKSFFTIAWSSFVARDSEGGLLRSSPGGRRAWSKMHFLVSEVEHAVRNWAAVRRPDCTPYKVSDGTLLAPHDRLFLKPKVLQARTAPFTHLGRYFNIGAFDTSELQRNLTRTMPRDGHLTLFMKYGRTHEDKQHTFHTHAARHLQNTELKRRGVSDAILTKRFNRTSVQQTQVYDHRSLREHLDGIAVAGEVQERLGPRATQTYKLITSGRVKGPLVKEFQDIQREKGDNAALEYLLAEADGLHITPYGFCVNAFTVDPCPNNLECFNGCRHLARSEKSEEQLALERLRARMAVIIAKIEAEPNNRPGRANQLKHARIRLENIETALLTRPGAKPFPEGPDLYKPVEATLGTTVLDGPAAALEAPIDARAKAADALCGSPRLDMSDA